MGGWVDEWVGALVSHDSSAQQMSGSNRVNVCVCVSTELPPAPFTSPLLLQYATDLVAKVTSCVDEFTSVLITTQQSWLVCVCVGVCPFKEGYNNSAKCGTHLFPFSLHSCKVKNQWDTGRAEALKPMDWFFFLRRVVFSFSLPKHVSLLLLF